MAKDLIQVTHGLKADLPQLMPGEIGFCTDTEEVFIGNGDGNANIPLGAKGDKGDKGDSGTNGRDGTDGTNGVTFTPSVSADGTLSWTNDGGLNNPDPVNIKGETGANGSNATVTVDSSLSGTSTNPVQNKVIRSALINVAAAFSKPMPIDYYNENLEAAHINNSCTPLPGEIYLAYGVSEGNYSVLEDLDNYLWYINTYIKTNDVVLLRIDSNPESEEIAGQCTVISTL